MKLISKISRMIDEVSFVFYDEPNAREKTETKEILTKRKGFYKRILKRFHKHYKPGEKKADESVVQKKVGKK